MLYNTRRELEIIGRIGALSDKFNVLSKLSTEVMDWSQFQKSYKSAMVNKPRGKSNSPDGFGIGGFVGMIVGGLTAALAISSFGITFEASNGLLAAAGILTGGVIGGTVLGAVIGSQVYQSSTDSRDAMVQAYDKYIKHIETTLANKTLKAETVIYNDVSPKVPHKESHRTR